MDDLTERVRRRLERIDPSPSAFEDTLRLVRRRQRNRRASAGAVGLVLTVALAAGLWAAMGRDDSEPVATGSPTTAPAIDGPRLILTGDGEAWVVDIGAGTAQRVAIPELSPGDPPYRVVRRDGKLVAWGYQTLVLDPELSSPPEVLAEDSGIFIASAVGDRVWVGIVDPASGGERRLKAVREIAVDGEVTVPDVAPPQGRWPVAALNQGLVFQGERNTLLVWDWRTGTSVDRLPGQFPLAWHGDVLAWCGGECQLVHIRDFATGDEFSFPCPGGTFGFDGYTGAFSPDGQTLALALSLDFGSDSRRALALIDVETGALDVVDGTNVEPGYVYVDWSPSGDAVFISGGSDHRQLIEYRPAEGEARTIPVEVGQFYGMAAI